MTASKKTREVDLEAAGALPDGAADWVYCEENARFERVSVRHSMNREAFRTVYDRMPEVVGSATNAIEYLTQMCGQGLGSVASKMYWPGEERIFTTTDGLKRLNTYVNDGIAPAEGRVEDDEDGAHHSEAQQREQGKFKPGMKRKSKDLVERVNALTGRAKSAEEKYATAEKTVAELRAEVDRLQGSGELGATAQGLLIHPA